MTISNQITLADIHRMPVGQLAALPADQLAMLKDAADQQLTQAKTVGIGSMVPSPSNTLTVPLNSVTAR
jgi:hypothetical protein